jgi:zinc-ribbon domain
MKNFWKWILGIVIVLVVLFGLGIGARLLMVNFLPARAVELEGFRSPMMGGRGFDNFGMMHHGGGFMFLGWLVPLLLVGLVAYGAYRLGKRKSFQAPLPPAAAAPLRTCPKCGSQVQEGWNNCANCGRKL